jgi:hypothetical protein
VMEKVRNNAPDDVNIMAIPKLLFCWSYIENKKSMHTSNSMCCMSERYAFPPQF